MRPAGSTAGHGGPVRAVTPVPATWAPVLVAGRAEDVPEEPPEPVVDPLEPVGPAGAASAAAGS
jgi:hypothetical protein